MKPKHRLARLVGMLLVLVLVVTALPVPAQAAQTGADLVRFTVVNRSTNILSFRLEGERIYTLKVDAESTKVFTVERGEYTYWVQGCGNVVVSDEIDLRKNKKMVMPVCGGRARKAASGGNTIDLSSQIKLVRIEVENDTGRSMLAILTGPSSYALRLQKDQDRFFTVAKGEYDVVLYACGTRFTRKFDAYKGQVLEVDCD